MKLAFSRRSIACVALAFGILTVAGGQSWKLAAQATAASTAVQPASGVRYSQVKESDMKEWLTYLASDQMQGRQVFTEGYGRATQYIAGLLKEFGVKDVEMPITSEKVWRILHGSGAGAGLAGGAR